MSYVNDVAVCATGAATCVAAVEVLPNTGGEVIFQIAAAVAGGMLAWGYYYTRTQRAGSR